jgi:hypothetical protein
VGDMKDVTGFLDSLNLELIVLSFPPLRHETNNDMNILIETIAPSLQIHYEHITLICPSASHTPVCIYSEIEAEIQAHSVTFNDHIIPVRLNNGDHDTDFSKSGGGFTIMAENLTVYTDNGISFPWGAGHDASVDFFVRTGPDNNGFHIDLSIVIPTTTTTIANAPFKLHVYGGNQSMGDNADTTYVWLQCGERRVLSTVIPIHNGFQHISLSWHTSGIIQIWVDGEMVGESIESVPERPEEGDVVFETSALHFVDGIREISNLHFSSVATSTCECKSGCPSHFYDDGSHGCIQCPENSITMSAGSISRSQCICMAGFVRDEENGGICIPEPNEYYGYNASELILRGFCEVTNGNNEIYASTNVSDIHGCDCSDECFDVSITSTGLRCCRNKCVMWPTSAYCNCQYDPITRKSYNKAYRTGELCSGYRCADGEKLAEGICIPCEVGSYQPMKVEAEAAPLTCKKCDTCNEGKYRAGCSVGNPGVCRTCTICDPNDVEVKQCDDISDTICSSSTDCAQFGVECPTGSYHAGCDPIIGEKGWCETCPVQTSADCPPGFFLNFLCTNGVGANKLSLQPNECLPCNRFKCDGIREQFPTARDCGNKGVGYQDTMLAETIICSGECTIATSRQWVKRPCQFSIVNATSPL